MQWYRKHLSMRQQVCHFNYRKSTIKPKASFRSLDCLKMMHVLVLGEQEQESWDFSQVIYADPTYFLQKSPYLHERCAQCLMWSILYSKFNKNLPILKKSAISQKLKIGKLIFHSFLHIPHLTCKFHHFRANNDTIVREGCFPTMDMQTPLPQELSSR